MKIFMKKYLQITIFSLLLVLAFVFGGIYSRYMTSQIEVHAEEQAIAQFNQSLINLAGMGSKVVEAAYEDMEKEYLVPGFANLTYNPELSGSYKILDENNIEVAVIYIIITVGRYDGVEVAYAINIETDTLIDVLVISNKETPAYFRTLDFGFYDQFENKTFDDVVFTIDAVSGSTYSSLAFDAGMNYARELYARDYGFEIPNIVYEINSVIRNFDLETFVEKPFIVNITYGPENNILEAYFDNQYNLVEIISGNMPDQTYLDLFKNDLPTTTFADMKTFIRSYDEVTRKIVIDTKAYGGMTVSVEFELNENLDSVTGILITSTQTYDSDYNDLYAGAPAPAVENAYRNQYLSDGTYHDSIAGATITGNGLIRIFTLMDDVLEAWNGGGN